MKLLRQIFQWTLSIAIFIGLIFLQMTKTAIAPNNELPKEDRSVASIQEENFDKILQRMQLCYGIQFSAPNVSVERRRTCKTILVQKLQQAIKVEAKYFPTTIRFQCQDTAEGQPIWEDWKGESVVTMQPNVENSSIDAVVQAQMRQATPQLLEKTEDVCNFLISCQRSIASLHFTSEQLKQCFLNQDPLKRRVIRHSFLSAVLGMEPEEIVANEVLGSPREKF